MSQDKKDNKEQEIKNQNDRRPCNCGPLIPRFYMIRPESTKCLKCGKLKRHN